MTLQVSTWSHVLTLYAINIDPDDTCGYVNTGYHHNNRCGRMAPFDACVGSLRLIELHWGESDLGGGTVKLTLFIPSTVDGDGDYVPPVTYETYLDPDTWYLSPVVFTIDAVTYTLSVCPDPHEPFPEWPLSTIYLKAAATSVTGETRAFGNLLCGSDCNPFDGRSSLSWTYNIYDDKITIVFSSVFGVARLEVDYDNGNWATGTYTLTLISDTLTVDITVSPGDSCDIPPPPPPCDPYTCFPTCLVKECDGTVSPNALFLDVTSLNGCCVNGSYEFTWDAGSNLYYSGQIGDPFLVTCGYVEIWYECSGFNLRRRVKVVDPNGGVSDTFQTVTGSCTDSPQNWYDSFDLLSTFFSPLCFNLPPFYSDTITFDVYTNN